MSTPRRPAPRSSAAPMIATCLDVTAADPTRPTGRGSRRGEQDRALGEVQELTEERTGLRRVHPVVRVIRVALAVAATRHRKDQQRAVVELRRARVAEAKPRAGADSVALL